MFKSTSILVVQTEKQTKGPEYADTCTTSKHILIPGYLVFIPLRCDQGSRNLFQHSLFHLPLGYPPTEQRCPVLVCVLRGGLRFMCNVMASTGAAVWTVVHHLPSAFYTFHLCSCISSWFSHTVHRIEIPNSWEHLQHHGSAHEYFHSTYRYYGSITPVTVHQQPGSTTASLCDCPGGLLCRCQESPDSSGFWAVF